MTAQLYKDKRKSLGYTQSELAGLLGVNRVTVARRETGGEVTNEAWLALCALPKKRKKKINPAQILEAAAKILKNDFGDKKNVL